MKLENPSIQTSQLLCPAPAGEHSESRSYRAQVRQRKAALTLNSPRGNDGTHPWQHFPVYFGFTVQYLFSRFSRRVRRLLPCWIKADRNSFDAVECGHNKHKRTHALDELKCRRYRCQVSRSFVVLVCRCARRRSIGNLLAKNWKDKHTDWDWNTNNGKGRQSFGKQSVEAEQTHCLSDWPNKHYEICKKKLFFWKRNFSVVEDIFCVWAPKPLDKKSRLRFIGINYKFKHYKFVIKPEIDRKDVIRNTIIREKVRLRGFLPKTPFAIPGWLLL